MIITLSNELVEDILERVSTKSLMRFKSVKRSWNSFFKTVTFVKGHSQRLRERALVEQFLTHQYSPSFNIGKKVRTMLLSSNHPNLLELPPPQFPSNQIYDTFSSFFHCNGVIFLNYSEKFVLWNPATREVKLILPSPPKKNIFVNPLIYFDHKYGFGADSNTFHDFKIVQISSLIFQDGYDNNIVKHISVKVYNTRMNSWTLLHDLDDNYFTCLPNYQYFDLYAFANGVFHWLSLDYTFILCFDFRSNQFHKLNTPSTLSSSIVEVNDSIAYVSKERVHEEENFLGTMYEIWILKQDNSWTKIYKVGPFYTFAKIEAILNNGTEFLSGSYREEIVSYNSNGHLVRKFLTPHKGYCREIYKYVESIAPLSL